jgi:hypothetical protein
MLCLQIMYHFSLTQEAFVHTGIRAHSGLD